MCVWGGGSFSFSPVTRSPDSPPFHSTALCSPIIHIRTSSSQTAAHLCSCSDSFPLSHHARPPPPTLTPFTCIPLSSHSLHSRFSPHILPYTLLLLLAPPSPLLPPLPSPRRARAASLCTPTSWALECSHSASTHSTRVSGLHFQGTATPVLLLGFLQTCPPPPLPPLPPPPLPPPSPPRTPPPPCNHHWFYR